MNSRILPVLVVLMTWPGPFCAAGIGTALFDSIFLAAGEVLPRASQRTALVVLSDGVDMGSRI